MGAGGLRGTGRTLPRLLCALTALGLEPRLGLPGRLCAHRPYCRYFRLAYTISARLRFCFQRRRSQNANIKPERPIRNADLGKDQETRQR